MSKKVFKFVKNGRVINQEKANIAFYGYVRGRFMDRVDFYDGYIDEQIGENEFIVPEDIADSFEYWGQMTTNFALAEMKYNAEKEIKGNLECFMDDMDIQWFSKNMEDEMMEYGRQAHQEGYDAFEGWCKEEDKKAQQWYIDLLAGQDNVINQVNDLI